MYIIGKDNIQVKQGKRTDFELIEEMIDEGYTSNEIMRINFRYRKYEKMIKSAFADKKLDEAPVKKQISGNGMSVRVVLVRHTVMNDYVNNMALMRFICQVTPQMVG